MSDEPKIQMPRRPEKRTPAVKRKVTKADRARLDEIEDDSELLSLEERACAMLCTEYSKEHAAATLGWDLQAVHETLDLPHVRLFIKKADEAFIRELAKAKVRRTTKVGISRAGIEQRLFELMMLDPADTKGSIEGQVKAAVALAERFGYGNVKGDDPLNGMTPEEMKALVAKQARLIEAKIEPPIN